MADQKMMTNSKFGKWGWSMIIYTGLLYYFWAGLSVDCMNLYPDAYANLMGCESTLLLGFATPAGIIGVVGGILFGRLVLKTGVRKLTSWTLIITGVLYVIFGFVKTPTMYFILLAAFTFVVQAFGLISTATIIGNWFPRKKGIALGWATMGAPLCTATFVAFVGWLYGVVGIEMSGVIVGAIVFVLGIISFFWIKEYPEDVGAYPDNINVGLEELQAQKEAIHNYKSPFTIGKLLKDKDMWLISIGFGMLWMVTIGIVSQFIPRMMSVGVEYGEAMTMMTIFAVIGLAGSYFWGWLDQKTNTKLASCVYAISYIIALLLLIFAQVKALQYVALLFVGFGIGGLLNLMASMVISVYGRYDFTAANSLISPIASLIRQFAFIIMAVLLTQSGGSYNLPYGVFIGIDIVGMILLLLVTNKCKGKNDPEVPVKNKQE